MNKKILIEKFGEIKARRFFNFLNLLRLKGFKVNFESSKGKRWVRIKR